MMRRVDQTKARQVFEQLSQQTIVQGQRGQYEVLNVVGRGGMGVVYRVRRQHDQSVWALKEQRPDTILGPTDASDNERLFEHEARLILRLQHPHIVSGEELFNWQQRWYLVMEFVPGETLEARLRNANAPAFEQDALHWALQMAQVLDYLHTQQPPIIYRDLKPANVILAANGTIKFIDFGVARTHKLGQSKDTIAIGTLGYAPPEQYGKDQTDARSDVYTLGATLYHLLTNTPPRPLQTPTSNEITALNPSVQSRTEQVVIRAMHQDRAERFASAAELQQALQQCIRSSTEAAAGGTQPVPPGAVVETLPKPLAPAPQPVPAAPASQPVLPRMQPITPAGSQTTFCSACGFGNKASARFCVNCGARLSTTAAQPAAVVSLAPPPPRRAISDARINVRTPHRTWIQVLHVLPCRIGRRDPSQGHYPELDLAEDDSGHASRRHAVIEQRDAEFTLTDSGSINGTLLNGLKIPAHQPQRLRNGDSIRIGDVEMRFEKP